MTSGSQNSLPAMISQPPTVMAAAERRSPHKITVTSLCCDTEEVNSAFTASTEDLHSYGLKASFTSHAAPIWAKRHQPECPGLSVILPLPLSLHFRYPNVFGPATQDSPSSCLDTTEILSGACDVTDSTSASVFRPNRAFDHHADLRVHPTTQMAHAWSPRRVLRPARPSYTDEQRFSIMYYRIVRKHSWPEVEDKLARLFNLRTKDAFTSVYYHIRKMWGMDNVLDTDLNSMGDRTRVDSEATRFSRDFLMDLGYFD